MTDPGLGVPAGALSDGDVTRELTRLHETRHETFLNGSEDALETHTRRMLELEDEYLRRFPATATANPARTRAGSRHPVSSGPVSSGPVTT